MTHPADLTPSRKLPDWPRRLSEYLAATEFTPFTWGAHDCCAFACNGIMALTGGHDPMADLRGTYSTRRGAMRLIADAGGLQALASERMGAPLPSPRLAQRGDLVLVDSPAGELLALCTGPAWAAAGEQGRVFGPMSAARMAWRV